MKQGPVDTTSSPYAKLRTVPIDAIVLGDGFWRKRQAINRTVSLRHGYRQLEAHGNFHNLMLAAGILSVAEDGGYNLPVFLDSDVYKWLEAVAYDLANHADREIAEMADRAIKLVQAAQEPSGYLNSYWQVVEPERKWQDIDHGHELYCAGHLFQAAVAFHRANGDDRLLIVARRFADHIDTVFGPNKQPATPGHPEVETALIELYRETAEPRYLNLAAFFLNQRGQKKLRGLGSIGPEYHQDRVSIRETDVVEGHAVRQLYLTAGVTDLYLETGEQALWDTLMGQWADFTQRKMHVTGGAGARHEGESFGEPYELPNDRCYCETCAQIASIQWNWRLLLATGDGRYADLMEHTLYNGFLSGQSLDGSRYFYVNPLLSRGGIERPEWYGTACCPPNVMRLLASLAHYFVTTSAEGVEIHQYASASGISAALPSGGEAKISMQTDFPWDGHIHLSVDATDGSEWTLRLRLPAWCAEWTCQINEQPVDGITIDQGYLCLRREWQIGDVLDLTLILTPRFVVSNPRVDATRGCVAIQRGPMIYCLEEEDQPAVDLMDVQVGISAGLTEEWKPDLLGGVVTIGAEGRVAEAGSQTNWLYRELGAGKANMTPVQLTAIPYYLWANRRPGKMRVWIPTANNETTT